MKSLKNWIVDNVLKHLVTNLGSNWLAVALSFVVATHVNWGVLAAGFGNHFSDPASHAEMLRVLGVLGADAYLMAVGRWPAIATVIGDIETAAKDGRDYLDKQAEKAAAGE